jgi:hypothetical protein
MVTLTAMVGGCGGGSSSSSNGAPTGLDDPALTETTTQGGQMEAAQWNAYSPAEQEAYRRGFDDCNQMVADANSPSYDPAGAADRSEQLGEGAEGDGCRDGIAGLPLAGSGIPVPP